MELRQINYVTRKLEWMAENEIWPNGLRYLWTDAFGLVLLVSLYRATERRGYLGQARELVDAVYRVLGRHKGLRIGEEPERDGQYFHYLMKWIYALMTLGEYLPDYRDEALQLVRQIHPHFVLPHRGVIWKMEEDLSGPYPGFGLGALDAFDGYVVYRLLDEEGLQREIAEMRELMIPGYQNLHIDQDLALGMMLWLGHFFPDESWSVHLHHSSLYQLDELWIEPPGYFCRQAGLRELKFAFTNYGISLGLQAVAKWPRRVRLINRNFEDYRSGDDYDRNAITHVMACTSHLPGLFLRHDRPGDNSGEGGKASMARHGQ